MKMMTNQEPLRELTESYLKSVIADAGGLLDGGFDSFAPFAELGIDSFRVLKIIRTLESEFGTLPKTLLFENFNVNDLARYFVNKHESVLATRFSSQLAAGAPAGASNDSPRAVPGGVREHATAGDLEEVLFSAVTGAAAARASRFVLFAANSAASSGRKANSVCARAASRRSSIADTSCPCRSMTICCKEAAPSSSARATWWWTRASSRRPGARSRRRPCF
jgi:acyl carrier protein